MLLLHRPDPDICKGRPRREQEKKEEFVVLQVPEHLSLHFPHYRQTVCLSVISDLFFFLMINTAAVFNGHLIPPTQVSLWRRACLGLLALKCQKNICVNLKMKEPDVTKTQRYTAWYTEKTETWGSLFSLLVRWQLPHILAVPSQMCRFPSPFLLRNCEWEQ